MTSLRPRLLVSVRDADEAFAAVVGGADIIDVKEPDNGSLGRALPSVMRSIADRITTRASGPVASNSNGARLGVFDTQLSLALGEVTEWMANKGPWCEELISFLPDAGAQYLKLGLAGLSRPGKSVTAWANSWRDVRQQIPGDHAWVAVAYADHIRAESPGVVAVCAAAAVSGCRILLIDTFKKDGASLLDFMTVGQLHAVRVYTEAAGLQLALAGQLTLRELPRLLPVRPDIIAVRGAVCKGGARAAAVSEEKVRAFLEAITAATYSL